MTTENIIRSHNNTDDSGFRSSNSSQQREVRVKTDITREEPK
ncbi:hypothetical protein [Halpernia sp. GG3]